MTDPIPTRPSGPHPTPEQLYLARGRQDEEAQRILRHAAVCAQCSVELARQEAFDAPEALSAALSADDVEVAWERFKRSSGEPTPQTPMPSLAPPRPPRRRSPVLALAATLAICAVGLEFWVTRTEQQAVNIERGAPAAAADWQPSGTLDTLPTVFTFPAPKDEPRRVRVFDASQDYTWTSEPTAGGRIAFPETERRRLRPGVKYFWTVLDGGEESAARSFRVLH